MKKTFRKIRSGLIVVWGIVLVSVVLSFAFMIKSESPVLSIAKSDMLTSVLLIIMFIFEKKLF